MICVCACAWVLKGTRVSLWTRLRVKSYISSSSFETWSSTGTFSAALSQFLIAVAQQPLHL